MEPYFRSFVVVIAYHHLSILSAFLSPLLQIGMFQHEP